MFDQLKGFSNFITLKNMVTAEELSKMAIW